MFLFFPSHVFSSPYQIIFQATQWSIPRTIQTLNETLMNMYCQKFNWYVYVTYNKKILQSFCNLTLKHFHIIDIHFSNPFVNIEIKLCKFGYKKQPNIYPHLTHWKKMKGKLTLYFYAVNHLKVEGGC